jgi:hypothetical protein
MKYVRRLSVALYQEKPPFPKRLRRRSTVLKSSITSFVKRQAQFVEVQQNGAIIHPDNCFPPDIAAKLH